jgi:predicted transcriptional regulator
MIITFAQYSILSSTYHGATCRQIQQQTSFDQMMISYYIMGLVKIGLLKGSDDNADEDTRYKLTELGETYIDDYERANPALVIKKDISQYSNLYNSFDVRLG